MFRNPEVPLQHMLSRIIESHSITWREVDFPLLRPLPISKESVVWDVLLNRGELESASLSVDVQKVSFCRFDIKSSFVGLPMPLNELSMRGGIDTS
jgi:hypothetical protein